MESIFSARGAAEAVPIWFVTSANYPDDTEGDPFRPGGSRCPPGHTGRHPAPPARIKTDMKLKNRPKHGQ